MTVSITIATHNHADLLDRTLSSLFCQHVPFPFEVIVVDDGSNDHTSRVLTQYPVVTTRIDRPAERRNPGLARNRAIALASADILIMQSDDVYHHSANTIAELVAYVEQHPMTAAFATVYNTDASGTILHTYQGRRHRRGLFFLGAIRREHVYAIGGNDEEFTSPGFEDTWLSCCLAYGAGVQFVFLNSPVGHHQDHPRTDESYGGTSYSRMGQLYRHKVNEAKAGRIPWKAKISSLYERPVGIGVRDDA